MNSMQIMRIFKSFSWIKAIYAVIPLLMLLTAVLVILISIKAYHILFSLSCNESDLSYYQLKLSMLGAEKSSYIITEYEGLIKYTEDINLVNSNVLYLQVSFRQNSPINNYYIQYIGTDYSFDC